MAADEYSVKNRLYVAGAIAGLAAIAILIASVLAFGRIDPSPPSLAGRPNPEIPGQVVYIHDDCVFVAAASGATTKKLECPGQLESVSWVDGATVAYSAFSSSGPRFRKIDVATGKESATEAGRDTFAVDYGQLEVSVRGESVRVEADGSVYRFDADGGGRVKILDYDGPSSRRLDLVTWSPDGNWFLLYYPSRNYSDGELWVVSRDGTARGTLATGVRPSASWWIDDAGYLPGGGSSPGPK